MASNQSLAVLAYRFNSTNNRLVMTETIGIPLPAQFVPCAPGPDQSMRVYSKILYGENFQQVAYVPNAVSELVTRSNA